MATPVPTMYSETQAFAICIWPNTELSMSLEQASLVFTHAKSCFLYIQEENHVARSNLPCS